MSDDGLKRDSKGRLVKGTPPGPGRPKGSISIVSRIKKKFEENPEYFDEWIDNLLEDPAQRRAIMEQIDGKPHQSSTVEMDMPDTLIGIIREAGKE